MNDAAAGYGLLSSLPPNPHPSLIEASNFRQAERAAREVMRLIHPTVASDRRRERIVEYLHDLFHRSFGFKTFPFGSFPLKTYLPDGDIDMTVIGIPSSQVLAPIVRSCLEKEEQNKDSVFVVNDVQYIDAEVKLVKCVVQNIVVDISFSQIGGLSTLCFLEQVDQFIGKDHLFKRSIMLIKAWCYYESRILGSYHGLISTYALETLVLYIFHLFHSSLGGPLSVLYRFLDYYSKFDWGKYCISLQGPVLLSSLPQLSVDTIDNDGGDLLLTDEFVKSCVDFFSVPMRSSEGNYRTFTKKHLNIVDPLRENNNLGRSVSLGSFYRIRSAFTYGARKLGQVLLLPPSSIRDEVNMFFASTRDQHDSEERPDVQDWVPRSTRVESGRVEHLSPIQKFEKERADKLSSVSRTSKASGDLNKGTKNVRFTGLDERGVIVAPQKTLSHEQQSSTSGEVDCISSKRITGDAKDVATLRTSVSKSATESPNTSSSTKRGSILDFRNAYNASSVRPSSIRALSSNAEMFTPWQPDSYQSLSNTGWVGNFGDGYPFEHLYSVNRNTAVPINEPSLNELSDLTGDCDLHLNNLNYAVWFHELVMSEQPFPMYQSPPTGYYIRNPNVRTHGSTFAGPLSYRPHFSPTPGYSMNQPFTSGGYNTDEPPKSRGLGTFLPNMTYRDKLSPGVRNAVPANHPAMSRINFQAGTPPDTSSVEKVSPQPAIQTQLLISGNERGKLPARLDTPQSSSQQAFAAPPSPGEITPFEHGKLESNSLGPVSIAAPSKEHDQKSDFPISDFTSLSSSSLRPPMSSTSGRKSKSYQMNDEDFPPLSG